MKGVIIFLSIISIRNQLTTSTTSEPTVGIETRIELLKQELIGELHELQNKPKEENTYDYEDIYEYVDNSNRPITPISIYDKRQKDNRFKLPELKSTTTEKFVANDTSPESKSKEHAEHLRINNKINKAAHKPLEIFYRKMTYDDNERNRPQKWTHCLDLLTPYLNGYKDNMTTIKKVDHKDSDITRLSQLLSHNMSNSSNDEIRSILYELSNLQFRLFQWDVTAIRTIIRIIIKNGTHDFKGLKYGIKRLFTSWKLDTSDVTTFLQQARIFRPPCIEVAEFEDSTMTPELIKLTKPDVKKKLCFDSDGRC